MLLRSEVNVDPTTGLLNPYLTAGYADRLARNQDQTAQQNRLQRGGRSNEDTQRGPGGRELTDEDLRKIQELKARDREVRAHEQAHTAAGGRYAGAPEFTMERGPDGVFYAVAGEVSISASPVSGDPQATISKMEQVRTAALAPADPSGQDRQVAAQAQAEITKARAELAQQRQEEREQVDLPAQAYLDTQTPYDQPPGVLLNVRA